MTRARFSQSGFTLIEAIMVIVITGILAGMVAVFMRSAIDSYFASQRRAVLTDAADEALRRIARDVRAALPNSVRVTDGTTSGSCSTSAANCYIEFIPTTGGGRYRAAGDGSTGGTILDFTDSTKKSFDVLGPVPSPLNVGASGDYLVIYNLGPGFSPADAYSGGNRAQMQTAGSTITLIANTFANTPPLPSPNNRFQVVPNSGPVTYACSPSVAGPVLRATGYGFLAAQPTNVATSSSPKLLDNATCQVDYSANALGRTGTLFIQLKVIDQASQESIIAFREIHVDNAP